MQWKWDAQSTFTALLIAGLGTCGGYLVKQIMPIYKSFKNLFKRLKRIEDIEDIETRIEIIENTFIALYDISIDPMFKTNNNGEVTYVNVAWLDMTGITDSKNAYGFGYMAAIPEEDIAKISRLNEQYTSHPSTYIGNIRFKNVTTGSIIEANCKSTVIYDFKNNITETIGRIYILKIIKNQ